MPFAGWFHYHKAAPKLAWPSLFAGDKGSKVLITTRNEAISTMAANILNINLQGLETEECLQILELYAFLEVSSRDQHDVELIARKIAEKCLGSPLAAKSTGLLLSRTNGQREQLEIILGDMQFLEHDRNTGTIVASLQISYQHLPYHLKWCFAFCSIFPIGYEFEKDEVVQLWIVDGLFSSNTRRTVEMVAGRCFDELLRRSFFETSNNFTNPKFRVPTLMLEQARLVSKHEALVLDPDSSQVTNHPEWIRYATILCPQEGPLALDIIHHYKNLRLLKLCPTMKLPSKQVPPTLFSELTWLRALDLSYTEIDFLPHSVGCSIHLRYLSLRNTLIKTLPDTVCQLFNLQTLDFDDCYSLMDLPEGMNHLVNMRHLCLHLDWDKVTAFRSMPIGIDKLLSLRTLSRFVVVARDGGSCNINELRNLKISGELCILKLEAATGDAAAEANLSSKKHLHKLMLKWSADTCKDQMQIEIEESERVIEALCPHTHVKHLRIDNYPGTRFLSWVETFLSLKSLEIISCPRLTQFPMGMSRPTLNVTM